MNVTIYVNGKPKRQCSKILKAWNYMRMLHTEALGKTTRPVITCASLGCDAPFVYSVAGFDNFYEWFNEQRRVAA